MKYILIALIAIIGGIIWLNTLPGAEAPVPVATETPVRTEPVTTPTAEDSPTDSQEIPTGNDVGMEYPETDMSVPTPSATDAKVYEISGKNFEFDIKEIRIKKNETVVIKFTSTDGFHDFVIDEFDAQTERIRTGDTTSVTFVADKAGTFEYYCSVGSHRVSGMTGKIVVE
ncbi:MAG: cupredoxin domain-containing protein [Candidatus Kaiserbacteria bacterium]|nr:cupredoxin domain-containing protein [Candidatus Kaiserbacteria bacterium]